jgi:predicted phosphodiesterase
MGLRLGVLTDLHWSTAPAMRGAWHNEWDFAGLQDRVRRAIAWFEREQVDLLALSGDLANRGDPGSMRAALQEIRSLSPLRAVAVSGNHDVACGADLLRTELHRLADPQLTPADRRGELRGGLRLAGVHLSPGTGLLRSRLRDQPAVDAWNGETVVLISHLPLLSRASAFAARGMPYPGDLIDRETAVAPLLARGGATVVLAGHIHARDVHRSGPVLQLTQAALVEPPFDASIVDVRLDRDAITVTRRTLRTGDQRAWPEPTLVGPTGGWAYWRGRWRDATDSVSASNTPATHLEIAN